MAAHRWVGLAAAAALSFAQAAAAQEIVATAGRDAVEAAPDCAAPVGPSKASSLIDGAVKGVGQAADTVGGLSGRAAGMVTGEGQDSVKTKALGAGVGAVIGIGGKAALAGKALGMVGMKGKDKADAAPGEAVAPGCGK